MCTTHCVTLFTMQLLGCVQHAYHPSLCLFPSCSFCSCNLALLRCCSSMSRWPYALLDQTLVSNSELCQDKTDCGSILAGCGAVWRNTAGRADREMSAGQPSMTALSKLMTAWLFMLAASLHVTASVSSSQMARTMCLATVHLMHAGH